MYKSVFVICFTLFLMPFFLLSQQKFKLKIDAPDYIGDSLIFSPLVFKVGLEDVYDLNVSVNKNVAYFSKMVKKMPVFEVKIYDDIIIEGDFMLPQPFSFQYFNKKSGKIYFSSIFFIDSGSYEVSVPNLLDKYEIKLNSPINQEYYKLKESLSDLYVTRKNTSNLDSLLDLEEKEKRIGAFIKRNNNSIVALWEILFDYTLHGYNYLYLENLALFSEKVKSTRVYNILKERLIAENSTMIGMSFPSIKFMNQEYMDIDFFKRNKLTFIDYWSTTCSPCIRAMPEILSMHKKYANKQVSFISIVDENQADRIKLANTILLKNGIKWAHYFDIKNEFKDKLGVIAYPLYLLVNDKGIIIEKSYGNLEVIKNRIAEFISASTPNKTNASIKSPVDFYHTGLLFCQL